MASKKILRGIKAYRVAVYPLAREFREFPDFKAAETEMHRLNRHVRCGHRVYARHKDGRITEVKERC